MRSLAARAGAVCACWHGLAAWDPAPVNRVLCALAGAACFEAVRTLRRVGGCPRNRRAPFDRTFKGTLP